MLPLLHQAGVHRPKVNGMLSPAAPHWRQKIATSMRIGDRIDRPRSQFGLHRHSSALGERRTCMAGLQMFMPGRGEGGAMRVRGSVSYVGRGPGPGRASDVAALRTKFWSKCEIDDISVQCPAQPKADAEDEGRGTKGHLTDDRRRASEPGQMRPYQLVARFATRRPRDTLDMASWPPLQASYRKEGQQNKTHRHPSQQNTSTPPPLLELVEAAASGRHQDVTPVWTTRLSDSLRHQTVPSPCGMVSPRLSCPSLSVVSRASNTH
jgi:hypothetical protein